MVTSGQFIIRNDLVTAIPADDTKQILHGFVLQQNHPNPFNPSTTIDFSLPRAGYLTLTVYNVLGEEVASLIAGDHAAGNFKATWGASGQPSGVYFCRLTAEEYVQTKKMILCR